jgi:meiotic recombination protein DMC1
LKKLKAVGICTVKGLKMVTKKKLSAIKGLSDAKVDKIREALLKSCGDGTVFCTALEVAVKRKNCFHIATGKFDLTIFSHNFLKKEQNNAFN